MSISPLVDAIPPASDASTTDVPAVAEAAPAPPVTPKKGRPKKVASPKKVAPPANAKTEVSPTGVDASSAIAAPVSPSAAGHVKFNDALKKAAVAMKMRGMTTKAISQSLNVNYKTVWNHIDKVIKAKAKPGTQDGIVAENKSESDKKECALALKLVGWSTKDIAETLDINYKTIWNYLDKQQKAAGLPRVVHDPDILVITISPSDKDYLAMELDNGFTAALDSFMSNTSANEAKPTFHSTPKLADMPGASTNASPPASRSRNCPKVPIRKTSKAEQEIILTMALSGKKPLQIAEALGLKANTVSKFLERKKKKALKNTDNDALQLLMQSSPPRQKGSR